MNIFIIRGKLQEVAGEQLGLVKLRIPHAKEFDKNSSETKGVSKCENKNPINKNVQSSTLSSLSSELIKFAIWGYKCDYRGTGLHHEASPSHLDHVLSKLDYPLAQGPLVLPIDCNQADNYHKSVQEVIANRTEFRHEEDGLSCFTCLPLKVGVKAWCEGAANLIGGYLIGGNLIRGNLIGGNLNTRKFDHTEISSPCLFHHPFYLTTGKFDHTEI